MAMPTKTADTFAAVNDIVKGSKAPGKWMIMNFHESMTKKSKVVIYHPREVAIYHKEHAKLVELSKKPEKEIKGKLGKHAKALKKVYKVQADQAEAKEPELTVNVRGLPGDTDEAKEALSYEQRETAILTDWCNKMKEWAGEDNTHPVAGLCEFNKKMFFATYIPENCPGKLRMITASGRVMLKQTLTFHKDVEATDAGDLDVKELIKQIPFNA